MSADPVEIDEQTTDQARLLNIIRDVVTESTLDWLDKWIDRKEMRTPGVTVAIHRRRLEIRRERETRDLPF